MRAERIQADIERDALASGAASFDDMRRHFELLGMDERSATIQAAILDDRRVIDSVRRSASG